MPQSTLERVRRLGLKVSILIALRFLIVPWFCLDKEDFFVAIRVTSFPYECNIVKYILTFKNITIKFSVYLMIKL